MSQTESTLSSSQSNNAVDEQQPGAKAAENDHAAGQLNNATGTYLSDYVFLAFEDSGEQFFAQLKQNLQGAHLEIVSRENFIEHFNSLSSPQNLNAILVVEDSLLANEQLYREFIETVFDQAHQNYLRVCTLQFFLEESDDIGQQFTSFHCPMISQNLKYRTFFIDTQDYQNDALKSLIVQSLGGVVSRTLSKDVVFAICNGSSNVNYKLARKLNLNILDESFIGLLLQKRALYNEMQLKEKIFKPFQGCVINLRLIPDTTTESDAEEAEKKLTYLKEAILANGGQVTANQSLYTHLVVYSHTSGGDGQGLFQLQNARKKILDILPQREHSIATGHLWIEDCAKVQYYLEPEDYLIKVEDDSESTGPSNSVSVNDFCTTIKKTSGNFDKGVFRKPLRSYSARHSTTSSASADRIYSSLHFPSEHQLNTSRFSLLAEIIETEIKYLKELQFIDEVYAKRIPCGTNCTENSITVVEFKTVFQPVRDLLKLHSEIYAKLAVLAENYDEITSCIGNIFIENFVKFEKHYKFLKRYGDLQNIMKKQPFEIVYREYVANPPAPNDPLSYVQPIKACQFGFRALQRLSGYTVILDRLVKKTHVEHIDHTKLKVASQNMKQMLTSLNENAKKFELELIHMELVYYLDKCPKLIESAKYALHHHTECQSVSTDCKTLKGLHLYLFESCIEITRQKAISRPMFSPKGHQKPRAMNNAVPIRKMKHIELIPMKYCQQVVHTRDERLGELLSIVYKKDGQVPTLKTFKCHPQNGSLECAQLFHETIRRYFDTVSTVTSDHMDDYSVFLIQNSCFQTFIKEWMAANCTGRLRSHPSGSAELKSGTGESNLGQNQQQSFNRRLSGRFTSLFKVFNPRPMRPSISYQSLDELN